MSLRRLIASPLLTETAPLLALHPWTAQAAPLSHEPPSPDPLCPSWWEQVGPPDPWAPGLSQLSLLRGPIWKSLPNKWMGQFGSCSFHLQLGTDEALWLPAVGDEYKGCLGRRCVGLGCGGSGRRLSALPHAAPRPDRVTPRLHLCPHSHCDLFRGAHVTQFGCWSTQERGTLSP